MHIDINTATTDSTLKFIQIKHSGVKYNGNKKYLLHTGHIHATLTFL